MSILRIFASMLRPAPHRKEIQNPQEVKKLYRYWRLRIFFGMYLGYVFYYFTRKSFTFTQVAMKQELGFDEVQLGWIGTVFALTYGVSKFTCGILSDRSNPRFFMGLGLLLTGVCNILFGFSTSLSTFVLFWGLNGWFQGTGWPPSARLLTHWYSQSERGRWWGLWNTSHNLGGAVIPVFATSCALWFGWSYGMIFPGIIGVFIGLFLLVCLRDTPQSLGLPSVEHFKNDFPEDAGEGAEEVELSTREILYQNVLSNRYIWILALSYFFVYVVRQAVNDWTVLYLTEVKGYDVITAGSCNFWFEIGGFFGSLAAGIMSDQFFTGRRGPVNVLFSAGMGVTTAFLWLHTSVNPYLDSFLIFVIGFMIFGPQMLIGVAAAELSHKKAAATATGFAGLFAYMGAACAGAPLGFVIRDWGWHTFFTTLAVCSAIATCLLLPLWNVKSKFKKNGV